MNIWIVVLVFIVIAIVIVLLLWAFWPQVTSRTNNQSSRRVTVGFLQTCGGNLVCDDNLTCVGGVCKRNEGGECRANTDCVPPANCLGQNVIGVGVCSTAQSNVLNGPCPCTDNNLTCDNSIGIGNGVCKISTGSPGCASNLDCLNEAVCITGICKMRKQAGEPCVMGECANNLVCSSGDCTNGQSYCQPSNISSCEVGATCNPDGMPGCNSGLMCDTNNLTCQTGTVGFNGACDDDSSFCISGLVCNDNGSCVFQQPPNDCSGNQGCPGGQTCSNGSCIVNTGDMCANDNNCISNTCNEATSAIYVWNVDTLNWNHYVNNPSNGVQFERITATSSLTNDILWGLDFSTNPTQGGLYKLINVRTGTWIKTYDGTTRKVSANVMNNRQTTTTSTIYSIATDRSNIYALVLTTIEVEDLTDSDNNTTTEQWGVFTIGINDSNSATFTSVPGANPPMVGSNLIINITDFDVNSEGDILLVGNTDSSNTSNTVYSKGSDANSFTEVPIDNRPNSFKQVRFYYVNNVSNRITLNNTQDVAYVSGDEMGNELLRFNGPISSISFPINGKNNYNIIDFSISDIVNFDSSFLVGNIDSIWMIATNPNSNSTGFYQIETGTQFSIPGYVGTQSLVLATNNQTYSQSTGVCA